MDALMSMVTPITTSSQTGDDMPRREIEPRKVSGQPAVSFHDQFQTIYSAPETGEVTKLAPTTRFRPAAMFLT